MQVILHHIEVAGRNAIDLEGKLSAAHQSPEYIRLFSGADGTSQGIYDPFACQAVQVHQGSLVKDSVLDIQVIGVLDSGTKNINTSIKILILAAPAHDLSIRLMKSPSENLCAAASPLEGRCISRPRQPSHSGTPKG